ncbi:amidophosphoribosyltransferase [Ruminococcaceae bacterium YRB3002]|nr:amidophosphoribosyltransferase [Ruminococcaceae bacterium YRB3002]
MLNTIHEECGVCGIYGGASGVKNLPGLVYYGLFALQHRGQESSGIAVSDGHRIRCHKAMGLVSEVFTTEILDGLNDAVIAIGHNRYSTTGASTVVNAQPLVSHNAQGSIAICHNGNLINCDELRAELERNGAIFHTTVDSEVISYLIAKEQDIKKAVSLIKGGYAILVEMPDKLIALRDPNGIKPLIMGKIGDATVFASESCALSSMGASIVRDVMPGEMITVDENGIRSEMFAEPGKEARCVFEYIYFARSDSRIDDVSVYESRIRAGRLLARQHPVDADCVIGVPESGIDAAMGFALESGIPYAKGFVKNSYVGRTFIKPSQEQREQAVRIKLNPIEPAVRGKRIVMIDDSIVRGTTIANIVHILRQAGALEVHVRISSPPFLHPCFYGTDVPSEDRLIACHNTVEEIRQLIGADSLGYLDPGSLAEMLGETGHRYCDACFTGNYPVVNNGKQE